MASLVPFIELFVRVFTKSPVLTSTKYKWKPSSLVSQFLFMRYHNTNFRLFFSRFLWRRGRYHVNPQTCKQSHTPTVVQAKGGRFFEKVLPLIDSLWFALQVEVYIMGCGTVGGPWRHPRWRPSCPPSWILLKMRNKKATVNNENIWL